MAGARSGARRPRRPGRDWPVARSFPSAGGCLRFPRFSPEKRFPSTDVPVRLVFRVGKFAHVKKHCTRSMRRFMRGKQSFCFARVTHIYYIKAKI